MTPSFSVSSQAGSIKLFVGIGYYWFRSVNISLDGLNVKKYWSIAVKVGYYWLKYWLRLTEMNRCLDWIVLINYWLRMTKTEYIEYIL